MRSDRLKFEEPLVLAGDYNVIPAAKDVHNAPAWTDDALFLPPTRARFHALLNLGLTEAIRATTDAGGLYTFWDYQAGAWQKNWGIAHRSPAAVAAGGRPAGRQPASTSTSAAAEKPSDHVPVWIELEVDP